ncbi:MAG: VOC family protein [Dehalococcoidia bacterium]|nr:VOC family protein [Dehalococcoidia bacterium]
MIQRNTPELFARDVDEAVRFYTEVLGFRLAHRVPEDSSQAAEWALVEQGNATFMFEKPAEPRSPYGVVFYLAVEDIEETAAALRSRGAMVQGPVDQWYGQREATVTDPSGYRLVFTAPVPAKQPAQA